MQTIYWCLMANVKVFLDDQHYTHERLIIELCNLESLIRSGGHDGCLSPVQRMGGEMELLLTHRNDGSLLECSCSGRKHMPTIIGIANDGIRYSQTKQQKEVFEAIRDDSLRWMRRLNEGQLNDDEMEEYGNWIEMVIDEADKIEKNWETCVIDTGSYLNRISGFSSEGIGFTKDQNEKKFMMDTRDMARQYYYHVSSGKINDRSAEAIREWARDRRRRISAKVWDGDLAKSSRKDEEAKLKQKSSSKSISKKVKPMPSKEEPCPTCTIIPEKYRKKPDTEQDYRFVSVDSGDGNRGMMKVSRQRENQDFVFIQR